MDLETHGTKGIIRNLGPVYQGRIENVSDLSGNSSNLDNGFGVETVKEINSGEEVATMVETGVFDANIEGKRIEGSVDEGTLANSIDIATGAVPETVIVMNSGATSTVNEETKDLGAKNEELGLRGGVVNGETPHGLGDGEVLNQVEQGSSQCSSNSVDRVVVETLIVIGPEENVGINGENQRLELKGNKMRSSKGTVDGSEAKVNKVGKSSCVIDITCGGGGTGGGGFKDNCDGEKVCRICHLGSEGLLESTDTNASATTNSMDLIQLGCGCKDDLGIAHVYCAEAWFKLKGSRICEICGGTATNITGVGDNPFLESRFISSTGFSSESSGGCLRGQPFCNFLMACLVIAFVLPWFFRVNMF